MSEHAIAPLLSVRGLSKSFTNSDGTASKILDNIDFTVEADEFVCILGPSGCGKTTFLRCIAGFEKYEGDIAIGGSIVKTPDIQRIMMFQEFNQLFPWKTVSKNVQYPLKVQGMKDKKELEHQAEVYLNKVGLWEYRDYYPHELSGGMKQRVSIARSWAIKPKLILMDEPFASLDALTRRKLQYELLKIKEQEDTTILFVTHNIQEALILSSRIITMGAGGTIVVDEANTLEQPVTPATPGFGELWNRFNASLGGQAGP